MKPKRRKAKAVVAWGVFDGRGALCFYGNWNEASVFRARRDALAELSHCEEGGGYTVRRVRIVPVRPRR